MIYSRVCTYVVLLCLCHASKYTDWNPKRSEPTILQIQKKRNTIQQVTTVYMYVFLIYIAVVSSSASFPDVSSDDSRRH